MKYHPLGGWIFIMLGAKSRQPLFSFDLSAFLS